MIVDFSQQLKKVTGEILHEQIVKDGVVVDGEKIITLRDVCQVSLLGQYQQEQADGAEKARRWLLAVTLPNGVLEIQPDDAVLMKKVIGFAYGPLVVGQAYEMLKG